MCYQCLPILVPNFGNRFVQTSSTHLIGLPVTLQPREDKKLAAFNLEEDSNPSPSNVKAADESLGFIQATQLAQGTGCADPSNVAEFSLSAARRHG